MGTTFYLYGDSSNATPDSEEFVDAAGRCNIENYKETVTGIHYNDDYNIVFPDSNSGAIKRLNVTSEFIDQNDSDGFTIDIQVFFNETDRIVFQVRQTETNEGLLYYEKEEDELTARVRVHTSLNESIFVNNVNNLDHVTISYKENYYKVFINGILRNTGYEVMGVLLNGNGNFYITNESWGDSAIINHFRISDKALYDEDFVIHYPLNVDYIVPSYIISGNVTENLSNLNNCTVRLYNRETGQLVDSTISNSEGYYEFNILNSNIEYQVVFLDNSGGVYYDDIIHRTSLGV